MKKLAKEDIDIWETSTEKYLNKIKKLCDNVDKKQIKRVIKILERKSNKGKTIFVCGNGGSAATASHFVCDLMKTSEQPFEVVCLNDNMPLVTAIANDWGYEYIFSFQLVALANEGDLLIVISGSGNSDNIIEAMKWAKKMKMETVAFLGKGGGKAKGMVDECVLVPSDEYGLIEDFHMILVHLITDHFKNL